MADTTTIDPYGFPMEIEFSYSPFRRGNRYEPDEHEETEIQAVRVGGIDIVEMLDNEQLDFIEAALIRKIHQDQDEARADAADYASDRVNGYSNVFFAALNRMASPR